MVWNWDLAGSDTRRCGLSFREAVSVVGGIIPCRRKFFNVEAACRGFVQRQATHQEPIFFPEVIVQGGLVLQTIEDSPDPWRVPSILEGWVVSPGDLLLRCKLLGLFG